ncbi:MAG: hypothetical protein Kow0089_17240 [Desulfobulbaceae bacterium]
MGDTHRNDQQDNRPEYVSPKVIRLDDVHRGLGACSIPGSGNVGSCDTGVGPTGNCKNPGSSADAANCAYHGIGAAGTCANPGTGPRIG